jgi:hypothetical protein
MSDDRPTGPIGQPPTGPVPGVPTGPLPQPPIPPGLPGAGAPEVAGGGPAGFAPGGPPVPPAPPEGTEGMPPEGAPPEAAEGAPGRRSRVMIFGIMGAVIVVVLVAVYFLFLRGGGEKAARPAPTGPAARPPVASPGPAIGTPGAAPAEGASPYPSLDPGLQPDVSESFQQYAARNPFKCTFACPQQQTTTAATTTGTSGTGTSSSPSPQGGTTSGTQQPSTSGASVTLKEIIGSDKAVVVVSGQTYTVAVGETFAGNYKLTRIAGSCASFLQGDSPFTLCTGQTVLK